MAASTLDAATKTTIAHVLAVAERIPETIRLSRRTHTVLWQNIVLALGIKTVLLVLAVFVSATMWMAAFVDMGASLLVVFNGLRLLQGRADSQGSRP